MSDDRDRRFTFIERVRRFFWLPREVPRGPAPILPLTRVWIFGVVAVGAGFAALGWGDWLYVIVISTVFALLDDVIEGVRHRWPAFVVALPAGWAADRLVRAVTSAPRDPDWAHYPGLVVGALVAFAVFVVITRLPDRRRAVRSVPS
ncbi:hypothetical protein [Streptomyces sp. NPDC058475]|uniref:hypothetical protein n=1 Tax=Streptomyces sp. NPDC058475 TaxID=3346518 RepID=UPI003665764F